MNNRELCNLFGSDENQKMLFSILEESQIKLKNDDTMTCIEEVYNALMGSIMENTKNISLMEINKMFIKEVIHKTRQIYNNNFYKNKIERREENQKEIQKKMNDHQKNFKSFNKKLPEQIDFTEKDWLVRGDVKEKIEIKIKQREMDLENITNSYKKVKNEDQFQNHSIWMNKSKNKKPKRSKNIKITNEKANIDTIEIKSKKRVHFADDDSSWKKKIEYLEKEVAEVKRLIREVLSEKLMKKSTS
jgi:hypothetical protein